MQRYKKGEGRKDSTQKRKNYGEHRLDMAKKLKRGQAKAIAALLTEATNQKAAKKAGVSYRSITRWLAEDSNFQAALSEAESNAVAGAARLISGGAVEAVEHFRTVLNDSKAAKNRRDRAADKLLRYFDKVRLLGAIEEKLAELESRL